MNSARAGLLEEVDLKEKVEGGEKEMVGQDKADWGRRPWPDFPVVSSLIPLQSECETLPLWSGSILNPQVSKMTQAPGRGDSGSKPLGTKEAVRRGDWEAV